ncbi:hypothetical protein KY342_06430 [Candidatus Woesearchaeota archaeon]|nr:hypothetical protein [Candidatus Woesearchaeota archaeon]
MKEEKTPKKDNQSNEDDLLTLLKVVKRKVEPGEDLTCLVCKEKISEEVLEHTFFGKPYCSKKCFEEVYYGYLYG